MGWIKGQYFFPYFSSSSGIARSPAGQKRLHVGLLKTEKLEQPKESCLIFCNNEMTTDITWSVQLLAVQLEAIQPVLEQGAKLYQHLSSHDYVTIAAIQVSADNSKTCPLD